MKFFKVLLSLSIAAVIFVTEAAETVVPSPTVTRTELRVAKSLNPEDTQTLNVMTRDGNVAQLIVKRRDAKSKLSTASSAPQTANTETKKDGELTRSFYSNWIPVQSVYLQPNLIRLDTFALVKNASEEKSINNNIGSVVSSDRIPHVPKPVTIRSGEIFHKLANERTKKARSLMEIDSDGIPVVHGVRVPDDETDEKVWRNARVINGELVPYEKGYKPPAAVPIGELVYANKIKKEPEQFRGIGPFTTSDNFQKTNEQNRNSFGPFTVRDNKPSEKTLQNENTQYVKFSSSEGMGPFSIADNSRNANSKLIDYIKEINEQESKRDYFSRRKYRSYVTENTPQIQRRMLQSPGSVSYPNSLLYSPPSTKLSHVNFNEGVRTPILQYAHPDLGVQPAKASAEDESTSTSDYESGTKDNDVNHSPYDVDVNANEDLEAGGRYSQSPYYANNVNSVDYYKKDVVNYPYNRYYINKKTNQPFWLRITESIKDNVQSGFERMHQLTRPVFDPIVEATHKITHNLGLVPQPQRAQEKVGFVAPVGGSIILPALGLVAGGAALGLGAAAVGRFLQPENMRAVRGMGYPNDILVIMEEANNQQEPAEHRRLRRSLETMDEQYLQELVGDVERDDLQHLTSPHLWSDTPCAKKLFCEVMVRQNPDEVVIMEKKMDSLLSIVHPEVMQTVSHHLQEVIEAVKKRECSKFICAKRLAIPIA